MTMSGIKRFGAAALGVTLVFATARAQQEPGAIERAGEKLDQAGRSILGGVERGLKRTGEAVRDSFEKTRVRVNDMNVEARVYGRIHWDKMLESSPIDLSAEAQGIVTLRGSVPSEEARKRAVDLAADTVGVTRVIDQLAVQSATEVVDPAPAPAAPRPRVKSSAPVVRPSPER